MAPFLKGANIAFKKFIEDGLADIDRSKGITKPDTASNNVGGGGGADNFGDPDFWARRLDQLMNKVPSDQNENVNIRADSVTISSNFHGRLPNREVCGEQNKVIFY